MLRHWVFIWSSMVELYVHTYLMLHYWMFTCMCTCTWSYPTACLFPCAHVLEATPLGVYLQMHTYLMLHYWVFTCMRKSTKCYGAGCLLACARRATHTCTTLLDAYLHVPVLDATLRHWMLTFMCTCAWCYATKCLLACAHVLDATPQDVYMHVHTYLMLLYCVLTCMLTRPRCYGTYTWCHATGCLLSCARTWCYTVEC